jgi:hypothetical protein
MILATFPLKYFGVFAKRTGILAKNYLAASMGPEIGIYGLKET